MDLLLWYATLPLLSARGPNHICPYLWLPTEHLILDERALPSTHHCKTEFLCILAHPSIKHHFNIQLRSSTTIPTKSVRNLGVVFDNQLKFTYHIAATTWTCRFSTITGKSDRLNQTVWKCLSTSNPSTGHIKTGLLQFSTGWPDAECIFTSGIQSA